MEDPAIRDPDVGAMELTPQDSFSTNHSVGLPKSHWFVSARTSVQGCPGLSGSTSVWTGESFSRSLVEEIKISHLLIWDTVCFFGKPFRSTNGSWGTKPRLADVNQIWPNQNLALCNCLAYKQVPCSHKTLEWRWYPFFTSFDIIRIIWYNIIYIYVYEYRIHVFSCRTVILAPFPVNF